MPASGPYPECLRSPGAFAPPRAAVPVHVLLLAAALLGAKPADGHAGEGAAVPPSAPAQVVEGRILDATDGTPVPQAVVRLVGPEGETVVSTLSAGDGRFRLAPPQPGTWRLEVQRIGYEPAHREVTLEEGETHEIEWRLSPDAMLLDPLVVIGDMEARPPRCVPQLVAGRVVDDATGEAIAGVRLELVGSTGRTVDATTSGADGRFALVTPGPGLYRLEGDADEHRGAAGPEVPILAGDTIEVEFTLARDRTVEAPMRVTSSARPWEDRMAIANPAPFFERMAGCQEETPEGARFGDFLDRRVIAEWSDHTHDGAVGAMLARESREVWSYTPEGFILVGSRCLPWVFIDGAVLGDTQPVLNHLDIDEIEAVEIYRSPHVPREYWSPRGQPCAAMAFWTRR
jgi:hypothetical protein